MKKIKYTLLVLLFALVVPFTCLAQVDGPSAQTDGPSDFGSESLGGTNQASNIGSKEEIAAANDYQDNNYPIDSNLWVLLLAGCTYMFYKYQKIQKKQKEDTVV